MCFKEFICWIRALKQESRVRGLSWEDSPSALFWMLEALKNFLLAGRVSFPAKSTKLIS